MLRVMVQRVVVGIRSDVYRCIEKTKTMRSGAAAQCITGVVNGQQPPVTITELCVDTAPSSIVTRSELRELLEALEGIQSALSDVESAMEELAELSE